MLNTYYSIYLINFLTGIESGLIKIAFTLWLKDIGFNIQNLANFNAIYLAFSFRIFWLPFVEKLKNPLNFLGHRKSWIIFVDIILALLIFVLTLVNPIEHINLIFIIGLIFAAFAATKESLAIAFQMENIESEKWGALEGKFMIYYNVGIWVGGILLFFSSQYYSWNLLFYYTSLFIACMVFLNIFLIKNTSQSIKNDKIQENFFAPYYNLIEKNKKYLFSLLIFIILYRIQDRILMSLGDYFLLDCHSSKIDFSLAKTIGIFATILGGLFGSYCVKKYKYHKTLKFGMILHAINFFLFVFQSYVKSNITLFYLVIIIEKLIRGFEGNVFFTYQLLFCNVEYALVQSSMLFALDKFFGTALIMFLGNVVEHFGWLILFIIAFSLTLPSLLFLKKLPNSKEIL